ncbi:hypothetical protein JB92DRAFT_1918576 [Gautieria morchelliformis]|nr:hypothetical protein JB92DRAFT_1918576 [Gautieria morchelliformis]
MGVIPFLLFSLLLHPCYCDCFFVSFHCFFRGLSSSFCADTRVNDIARAESEVAEQPEIAHTAGLALMNAASDGTFCNVDKHPLPGFRF